MKVLVTGATGFIGSWLARFLVETGHEVHILHRARSDLSALEGLPYRSHIGDITDISSLSLCLAENFDTIFHLAGVIGYTPDQREIMERVNVQGTRNLLEGILKHPVRRLVHMSSVVAVGASFDGIEPLSEDSPYNLNQLNLGYFETKRSAEQLILKYQNEKKIDAVIVNPSTVYGPGDAQKGSRKLQTKAALKGLAFYTPGGVSIIDIEDLIQGVIAAWKVGRSGQRYILSGDNITIKELLGEIANIGGQKPPFIELKRPILMGIGLADQQLRKVGLKAPLSLENAWTTTLYHWFDNSKAKLELGLNPKPASFALERSVRWMMDHRKQLGY